MAGYTTFLDWDRQPRYSAMKTPAFQPKPARAMEEIVPRLEGLGVHPIGRYGAWTYSYMERALLDGLAATPARATAET